MGKQTFEANKKKTPKIGNRPRRQQSAQSSAPSPEALKLLLYLQQSYGNHTARSMIQQTLNSTPVNAVTPNKPIPAAGALGHVASYNRQAKAVYDSAGKRLTENEHIVPRGNLEAVTMDPGTGVPDYQNQHYRNNSTVIVERDMALNKTHGNRGGTNADNPRTERLKQAVRNGDGINYREQVFMDSIDNAKRARDATGSVVTDEAIHRGALNQDGELFSIHRMNETGSKIGATADDIERALESFDLTEAPAVEASAAKMKTATKLLRGIGTTLDVGGSLIGSATGGWQLGSGINQIAEGDTELGMIDVVEGGSNLGMGIGIPMALKAGTIAAGGSAAALGAVTMAAGASIGLAAETARAAVKGEKTPIDVADEFYGTHFGDIYGWITGEYSKK